MGKCKITEVQQNGANVVNPVIVGWDHGMLKEEFATTAKCQVLTHPKNGELNSVSVKINDSCTYEGIVTDKPLCRTFIAIRSRNKKKPSRSKLKLFEASSVLLEEKKILTQEDLNDSITKFSDLNHMDKFFKVFGSKQGLRRHTTLQKMNIVSGQEVRETVKEQLIQAEENTEDVQDTSGNVEIIMPLYNRLAKAKEDVYSVNYIIPEDVMLELEEDAQTVYDQVKNNIALSSEEYTSYFIENLKAISKAKVVKIESEIMIEKIKILVFGELLLKLLNSRREAENKRFKLIEKLPITNQYILDNYLVQSVDRRQLTAQMQDKCVCHVMILALLACSYILDIKSLSSSVPFNPDKIRPMLQIIGVVPIPNSDKRLYMLKTPLPPLPTFHNIKRGVKRRRT